MNWLAKIFSIIPMVPGIVQGIEQIHGDAKSGADKKQLALEALGLAGATVDTVAPGEQPIVAAVTSFASNLIDQSVALFNQVGWAHKS